MPDSPHAKAFQRAVEAFGSVKALSHWLKVPSDTITTWISGEDVPPRAIFLQVVNFLENAEKKVTAQPSPASSGSPGIGSGMRIVVAEDDRDALMTLGILLRSEGFEVELLQRGHDVPGTVGTFRPHAVLLDLSTPDTNGYEVATEITQTYGNARPVLIAVTGPSNELDTQAAELCGFDHFVSKPYNPDSLLALLASLKAKPASPDTCNCVRRRADGTWICISDCTLEAPGGRIQLTRGRVFKPGMVFMGLDVAKWLNQICGTR